VEQRSIPTLQRFTRFVRFRTPRERSKSALPGTTTNWGTTPNNTRLCWHSLSWSSARALPTRRLAEPYATSGRTESPRQRTVLPWASRTPAIAARSIGPIASSRAIYSGQRFEEALNAIFPWLTVSPECLQIATYLSETGVAQRTPTAALRLLTAIVDTTQQIPPYGLATLLNTLEAADGTLADSQAFRRLRAYAILFGAT
jgi:hypothetical protein